MKNKDSEEKKWRDHIMNKMCDNLEKSSKVPYVTTPERSVSEIVEEVIISVGRTGDVEGQIARAIRAERQRCEEMVVAERERFRETNIKKLVEEMAEDAQEYGQYHGEDCPCNMEDPDECDCEEMRFITRFTNEWMGKVNAMWALNLQNHRKHCTPDGNKQLTRVKKAITHPNNPK